MWKFKKGDLVIFDKKIIDEANSYMAGGDYTYSPDFLRNVAEYGPVREVINAMLLSTMLYKLSDCEFYVHEERLRPLRVNMK